MQTLTNRVSPMYNYSPEMYEEILIYLQTYYTL